MMKKFCLIIFISLTILMSPCLWANSNSNQKGETAMHINKPFVTLALSFAGCDYIPEVNGVNFKNSLGTAGVVKTHMPINLWLKPGKNTISLILKPGDDADQLVQWDQACEAVVTLQVKSADQKNNYQPIMTYHFHSKANNITKNESHFKGTTQAGQLDSSQDFKRVDSGGDIQIGPLHIEQIDTKYGPGVKMTREVDLPLPFPKWAWFDGDQIPNNEETKKELVEQYKKIWEALHDNNLQKIDGMFSKRAEEFSQAFYKPLNEFDTIQAMQEDVNNPNLELGGPFKAKYTHVALSGNGKLAALMVNSDNDGCIFFNNNKTDISSTYNIWFMKKDGEWKIIR